MSNTTRNGPSQTFVLPPMETDSPDGCPSCAERVAERLREVDGITAVGIEPSPARVVYSYDPDRISEDQIERLATETVQDIGSRYVHETLAIEGMDCADCARKVETGVLRLNGVEHTAVNLMAARLDVEYDQSMVDISSINKRVKELGYDVAQSTPDEEEKSPLRRTLVRRDNILAMITAAFAAVGVALMLLGASETVTTLVFIPGILIGGTPLAIKGIQTLRTTRSLDINLLMTIAVIGAAALGEWLEAATVVVLFAASEALEGYAMDRTRNSIRSLMEIAPATAIVRRDSEDHEVPVEQVEPGETVVVRPGQRIPLDGTVLTGTSSVNQAPLTGESLPVTKEQGEPLYAGTLNGNGALTMRVTRIAADSSVAKIIHLVEQAQSQRAPSQRLVDRFAQYYTPAVVVLAAAVATIPPLFGADFESWFYRGLVLLVIACPCALVLSTPVAIVSALASATRHGILIKGGAILERAAGITTMAFDKTGTLTSGEPQVTAVHGLGGRSESETLEIAAALEQRSHHPLGQAIVQASRDRQLATIVPSDEQTIPGIGMTGKVDGREYWIGSQKLFDDSAITDEVQGAIADIEAVGGTAVLLGTPSEIHGVIGLADTVRRDARIAADRLHKIGVKRLVVLSGDREPAVQEIARQVGIDEVRAGLMPDEKLSAITEMKERGDVVAMVGDGVNDAPALATADVGIAMGVAGSDTALETADIALMGDDLNGVSRIVELGRRAKRTIAVNIGLALGIKVIFLTLAIAGMTTLWLAIFADVGAALIVIANGLRLFGDKPEGASGEAVATTPAPSPAP